MTKPLDDTKPIKVDINYTMVKTPVRISIGGKDYPIHRWNIDVVEEYWATGNETVLDKLKDFALEF